MTALPAGAPRDGAIEREVLAVVEALVAELGSPRAGAKVSLDDSFERDLGLGSLERVELLVRLEKATAIRLPDAVMAEAVCPRDLAAALAAGARARPEALPQRLPELVPGTAAPPSADTLVEALRWHATRSPERVNVFLRDEDGAERPLRYGALWKRATAIAGGLRGRGLEDGERVALMLRTEAAFFESFFGVLLAGAVPVPIYPPFRPDQIEEYAARQTGILRNAGARLLLTFPQALRVAGLLEARVPSLVEVAVADRLAESGIAAVATRCRGDDPALIQYTSGSTGEPKGVLLTHRNLLANVTGIGRAIDIRPDDVGVSWLPLYHDMGLIGSWLTALFYGVPIAILSPLAFLARPARWLWTLHAHGGTVSPAPNFAFELCVRRIADAEVEGLDLARWRLAFNGSEPVSPDTIERFTKRFAPYGFRSKSMCPVYGLAESSVALTVSPLGREPRVDRILRARFQETREALPAPPGEANPLRFVSCGRPLAAHAVRVVDASRRPLPERIEGVIEFRGPSVTAGYFGRPDATSDAVHDGWMDSGDLGYVADGELFVTGRRKDVVIKAGRNLYPQEIEEVVGDLPGIRKGCVAAFGVPDPEAGTERLVVVAESRDESAGGRERLRAAVTDRVVAVLGVPPDTVVIAPPRTVLKTSSGKIRRRATRDAYLDGSLARGRRAVVSQWAGLAASYAAARARRGLAGAARGLYALWVGLLLAIVLPLLQVALWIAPRGRPSDRVVRRSCRALLALAGCRIRVEGAGHLADAGPAVLAANHSSYVDSVALLAAVPGFFLFVAKRELLASPLVGTIIRKVGHLAVERFDLSRSVSDAAAVSGALQQGASLLVFPEGTFRRTPGLLPFRLGAFKAAVESGRPVVPIAIRGTRAILPPDEWLPRPGLVEISIGEPIRPAAPGWPEMVRLRDLTRGEIARRLG